MPIAPVTNLIRGVTDLASMFRMREDTPNVFEDKQVTLDEFSALMTQVMQNITGEEATEETDEPGEASKAEKMADSIAPAVFGMFDKDKNGVLEGDEMETLEDILSFFNPDILRNAYPPPSEEPQHHEMNSPAPPMKPPVPEEIKTIPQPLQSAARAIKLNSWPGHIGPRGEK